MPAAKDGQQQTFFQSDNNNASHLVGSVHTNPLSSRCDCVFIESSSRSTDDSKIYRENRPDLSTSGKVELSKSDQVAVYGSVTGTKLADVTEVNKKKRINGVTYSNLVEISHLGFTDGDSGAPVLKATKGYPYGSMNIGQAYDDYGNLKNYAHSWSFIKSQLGLR